MSTDEVLRRLRDAQDDRPTTDEMWRLLRDAELEIEHWRDAYQADAA